MESFKVEDGAVTMCGKVVARINPVRKTKTGWAIGDRVINQCDVTDVRCDFEAVEDATSRARMPYFIVMETFTKGDNGAWVRDFTVLEAMSSGIAKACAVMMAGSTHDGKLYGRGKTCKNPRAFDVVARLSDFIEVICERIRDIIDGDCQLGDKAMQLRKMSSIASTMGCKEVAWHIDSICEMRQRIDILEGQEGSCVFGEEVKRIEAAMIAEHGLIMEQYKAQLERENSKL